ncbi:nuclear inhibitor of protein phosphatase 1 [Phlebotomus argentipes]|uniref:nuclear inhibitor of protein phosphatase 1 n=1 Tax=Phlebotomus argentipes TaxID=94469 RepID=UPI0028937134|nr:nuclear inhibitor of protein phosphatase 1 [Phlebotomus argentipes]
MSNHYEVPKWAGKPPTGFHLDVLKEDKLIQKLMIDEKKCYLFGRNSQLNDFCIDHQSCSRVHAAYVYHKHLHISYLVDLGSTHGTFIGNVRLEAHKPTQLHMNSQFHFGASTRSYILRERPTTGVRPNIMEDLPLSDAPEGALLGLPESQSELDNLTEYNTATNRRISMLGIADDSYKSNLDKDKSNRKRMRKCVTFNDDEIVINPEDIDPTIGRFRNLIHTTVVPTKRAKMDIGIPTTSSSSAVDAKHLHPTALVPHLYHGLPPSAEEGKFDADDEATPLSLGSKLGLLLPNPAPDVLPTGVAEAPEAMAPPQTTQARLEEPEMHGDEPRKKKYAKEAWPGRKPLMSGL